MKIPLIIITALTTIMVTSGLLLAQPPLPMDPVQAPIDGGLSLLMAAGGAYAIKKLRDKNDNSEDV